MEPTLNDKIKACIVYFTNNTTSIHLGMVKIFLLFFFIDMEHIKQFGKPILYDTYYRRGKMFKPIGVNLFLKMAYDDKKIIDDVCHPIRAKLLKTFNKIYPKVSFKGRYSNLFSDSELNIMKSVCRLYANHTGLRMQEIVYSLSITKQVKNGDILPYNLFGTLPGSRFTPLEIDILSSRD